MCARADHAGHLSAIAAATATTPAAAQSLDALYAAAKAEGQVALYSTLNTTYSQPLIAKFQQRFPGSRSVTIDS